MVRVKICGITNARDARSAIDLGAAALGFNFYEKSPRAVAPAEAWQIRQTMPEEFAGGRSFRELGSRYGFALAQR